ncbi:hypothetical protein [Saccharibacillus brassicae]|uniref:Uncharacterized protein n=1 Tax=Saccharibacillus brassicae TaxID=2583377 RepID=A0A4Y6UWH4_SACBS|nr:hypothetical protein [Saccharibacillus brassicae]QDH22082.1 hypothetical protein FFV09_15260 [Saccharibacillus brassicae]
MELYFGGKKRFGKSTIRQIGGSRKGSVDYRFKGADGLCVLDGDDYVLYRTYRERLSERWTVRNAKEEVAGTLSRESAFSDTRFEYDAGGRGTYLIEEDIGGYRIEGTGQAAFVDLKRRRLQSDEYWLQTDDTQNGGVSEYEWVAVIHGISALRERSPWTTAVTAIGRIFS